MALARGQGRPSSAWCAIINLRVKEGVSDVDHRRSASRRSLKVRPQEGRYRFAGSASRALAPSASITSPLISKKHVKDHHSRRGLLMMVSTAAACSIISSDQTPAAYEELIGRAGLRR